MISANGDWSVIGIPHAFSGGWSSSHGAVTGYFQHTCTGPYGFVTRARTWTVTQLDDSAIDPGSLRHAIDAAAPGDTIKFRPGLSGTISIGSEYFINQDLTIDGPGASHPRIDAGFQSRIFAIVAGNVSISGLTLGHGSIASTPFNPSAEGGAIEDKSNGALSVSGVTFAGDRAARAPAGSVPAGRSTRSLVRCRCARACSREIAPAGTAASGRWAGRALEARSTPAVRQCPWLGRCSCVTAPAGAPAAGT